MTQQKFLTDNVNPVKEKSPSTHSWESPFFVCARKPFTRGSCPFYTGHEHTNVTSWVGGAATRWTSKQGSLFSKPLLFEKKIKGKKKASKDTHLPRESNSVSWPMSTNTKRNLYPNPFSSDLVALHFFPVWRFLLAVVLLLRFVGSLFLFTAAN